ncbi:hypothetical protein [Halopseudomonas laoshanensis]|uniref:hypothetical protein n=1 Tax=Halopseudomonas laoshanensis TaxID=2268758 RepID=UPI0037351972
MKQQISNIIIACIISGTILYLSGAFNKPEPTYATAHFDGGFILIGEIAQQRYFSDMKITLEDETLYSGSISEVIESIENDLVQDEEAFSSKTFVDGVRVKGKVGLKWVGSEAPFQITTETFDFRSTENNPLILVDIISQLKALEADVKINHQSHANDILTFGQAPEKSFLLSKLINAFKG